MLNFIVISIHLEQIALNKR